MGIFYSIPKAIFHLPKEDGMSVSHAPEILRSHAGCDAKGIMEKKMETTILGKIGFLVSLRRCVLSPTSQQHSCCVW